MAEEQWVNLPKDSKYEESGITKDRLGGLSMKIDFDKSDPPQLWKVKVSPVGSDNIEYSAKEKGRNERFKVRTDFSFGISDELELELEENIFLPAAGGNKFKIETKDGDGKVVGTAVEVETRRKLYYQVICMKGVTAPPMKSMEDEFWNPAKKYYLKLAAPEAEAEMKYHKNIKDDWSGTAGREDMFKESKKNYGLKKLHPFCFVIVCSNQNASIMDYKFKFPFKLYGKLFKNQDTEIEVELPRGRFLWFDYDDIDDAKNGGRGRWLKRRVQFNDGKAAPIKLDNADVVLGPKSGKFHQKIKVTLKKDLRHLIMTRKGNLELSVRVVAGFSGGYSDPMANFITVCNHAWHKDIPTSERMQTLVHEVGHKVGMVSDGTGIAPDAPPNLYGNFRSGPKENNQGHQGPHCEKGITYNKANDSWTGAPGCVMFGANIGGGNTTPPTFCSDCEKAVRKMDIDARELFNFKKFITDYS
jgi:hypothetical protein